MNQFCLVGKIASMPQIQTGACGWKYCTVMIEVERPFANSKGEFESDLMTLEVWRGAAETLSACARINSWITARGRIQTRSCERDGNNCTLVVERIEYIH